MSASTQGWDAAIVADDLTGAGDSAVQFADAGWRVLLAVGPDAGSPPPPDAGPALVASSTDVRAARPPVARGVVRQRVESLLASGVPRVYLKVDSTLRGSVADQVLGALDAWLRHRPDGFAVVCPAYPAMGRTVTGGRAAVHGRPLEEAAPGADPVTPVRTSVLTELLPGARYVPSPAGGGAEGLAEALVEAADGGSRVLVVDAVDDAGLERLALAVRRTEGRALPVGSAGLAEPLAASWLDGVPGHVPEPAGGAAPGGPVLVLVTSLHPVALEQVDRLRRRPGTRTVRVGTDDPEALAEPGDVLLVVTPAPGAGTPRRAAAAVATGTAAVLVRLHERWGAAAVVAVGGDGAAALLERWRSSGLAVRGALGEGVPAGELVGGATAGLPFASKAGGFGDAGTLVQVVDALRARARGAPAV